MEQTPSAKKICLVSLGCPKNLVDSELMLGFLRRDGFELTTREEEANVLIVNTCGFVEDSKKESIDHLLRLADYKKSGNCELLVATGCLSQRYSQQLSVEMPEIDLLLGVGDFAKLPQLLKEKFSTQTEVARDQVRPVYFLRENKTGLKPILPDPDLPRLRATPAHYSYLKISEGCSHRCSFCIIPHIRGDLVSRSMDSIVAELQQLVGEGVREFNLVAQDLNEYGKDLRDGSNLSELLQRLNRVPGDFWLRPHYMYPLEFTDRLIGILRDSEHIVKYVDMPLQHINDRVMRSMKRGSPARYVRQVLAQLKKAIPELVLRSTFIVGYPGETELEFQELCDFVREYQFDRVGVFKFSIEEGTSAALLPEQISEEIKAERFARLMEIQQKISYHKNQALIGKTFRILCEGAAEEDDRVLQGRLSTQAPEIDGVTYLSETVAEPGDFITATILEAHDYDLVARASESKFQ